MQRKYALAILALAFIICGCFPVISKQRDMHLAETTLSWYAYWNENAAQENRLKAEYEKRIALYLQLYPETSKEIADKMKACRVTLGMTAEQVLTMVKPHYILKGKRKNEKIFKYSNVGKFEWSKYIGEGVKVWVTLADGVVTDIKEVNLVLGY